MATQIKEMLDMLVEGSADVDLIIRRHQSGECLDRGEIDSLIAAINGLTPVLLLLQNDNKVTSNRIDQLGRFVEMALYWPLWKLWKHRIQLKANGIKRPDWM